MLAVFCFHRFVTNALHKQFELSFYFRVREIVTIKFFFYRSISWWASINCGSELVQQQIHIAV